MPLVTSHAAAGGAVTAQHGDEVVLACYGGKFIAYPLLETVSAVCEGGRYRARHDGQLRSLLELGCQEDIFEDVLHSVDHCAAPLQGRAYQTREPTSGRTRHLATVCFDADRGVAQWARATNAPRNALPLRAHNERPSPLTLLGNFNHMFDAKTRHEAERLYSDDARMTKRVLEQFKHDGYAFADQKLTPGKLLATDYFEDQNMRVTDFVSNQVPVWASVEQGNLRHMHRDVARFLRQIHAHSALDVYSGTHGVLSLRAGNARREVTLKQGRFPVPKYIWTIVHDAVTHRAIALVVLNDPFVAVSEIREDVFCESVCGRVRWLKDLPKQRNYEVPLYGLTFCCTVHDFTSIVPSMPKDILRDVPPGNAGMLLDPFPASDVVKNAV
ncbi:DNA/RNA non-specific endonuclease domain-containing protein [Phthorimaea operculella]|nr:DNA/RNA non-specific endonuclease domain-containing protein [Phthorimaea operculella]